MKNLIRLAVGLSLITTLLGEELTADYGDALLREWVQPEYPEAAQKAKLEGDVKVEFVVGIDGHVSQATVKESANDVFNEPALKAVRQWVFSPAIEEGKPAASGLGVTVPFRLAQLRSKPKAMALPDEQFMPGTLKLTPARVKFVPDPEYPAELLDKKLPGTVEIEFVVDPEGKAQSPKVKWASHAAFVESALHSIEQAQIEPAHQGPVGKSARMGYPAEFESVDAKRDEILAANHVTVLTDPAPSVLPTPVVLIDPVYPYTRLLGAERGAAVVEFSLGLEGRVADVRIASASAPEFGDALAAAVEAWAFKPALSGGTAQSVSMRVAYDFIPAPDGPVAPLVAALQPGGAGVSGAAGLDRKLKPLWRGFPVYPSALLTERPVGQATIEFVIDRQGRARVPRVVSASKPEFGWAAATAISQWVFERPLRHGEPVDVRVSIPVSFPPPAAK